MPAFAVILPPLPPDSDSGATDRYLEDFYDAGYESGEIEKDAVLMHIDMQERYVNIIVCFVRKCNGGTVIISLAQIVKAGVNNPVSGAVRYFLLRLAVSLDIDVALLHVNVHQHRVRRLKAAKEAAGDMSAAADILTRAPEDIFEQCKRAGHNAGKADRRAVRPGGATGKGGKEHEPELKAF